MEKKYKDMMYSIIVGITFLGLAVFCWLKPAEEFSVTERRKLEQFPEVSISSLISGKFMEEFEEYSLDQFPLRDTFRSIKAWTYKYMLGQRDNQQIYEVDGYISKLDYPLSEKALESAVRKFDYIYENYIEGSQAKVYCAWIPDKNAYLAEENGYPSYDYESMYAYLNQRLDYMTYIDVTDLLSLEDYYYTDIHWRQENLTDIAQRLGSEMGVSLVAEYEEVQLDTDFFGVYYGQLGLPMEPDKITYLNQSIFSECTIINHETEEKILMYDMELATGRDPYEMYLSGSVSVITIENPNATTDKELVIFRDSFGSSIAPLLVEGYSKTTLLDIRYLNQNLIENFVTFENQDVLFLYSTSVLNNEGAFK